MLKPIRRQTNLIIKKHYYQLQIMHQYQLELERFVKTLEPESNTDQKPNYILETLYPTHETLRSQSALCMSKENILYILLVASEFKQNSLKKKYFISKYFPKSILKSLVANNINKSLIGSGITFLVSYFPRDTLGIKAYGEIENEKMDSKMYAGKICHSSFLYDKLESLTKEKDNTSINLLDICLGALVLKPNGISKKAHVTFIEPSELKQSFKTYGKLGLNSVPKPNMLAFTHISQKFQSQLRQCSLSSVLPCVKLLTIFKQKIFQESQKT